ncbi:MAG: DUF2059 domain-containing protein [Verrucomicrobiota bacterium]
MKTLVLTILFTALTFHSWSQLDSESTTQSSPSDTTAPSEANRLAAELLELTGTKQIVSQIKQQIQTRQLQVLQARGLRPDDTEGANLYLDELDTFLDSQLSWDKFEPEFVGLYTNVFSQEELKGLVDFYRSPLGDKILTKMPQLLQQTAQLTQSRAQALSPDIQRITEEFLLKSTAKPDESTSESKPVTKPAPSPESPQSPAPEQDNEGGLSL